MKVLVLIWCIGMALYAALGLLMVVVVKALA